MMMLFLNYMTMNVKFYGSHPHRYILYGSTYLLYNQMVNKVFTFFFLLWYTHPNIVRAMEREKRKICAAHFSWKYFKNGISLYFSIKHEKQNIPNSSYFIKLHLKWRKWVQFYGYKMYAGIDFNGRFSWHFISFITFI